VVLFLYDEVIDLSSVGINMKNFREEKNITQEKMAEDLGVTRQAISNWECGKTQPDLDMLQKISTYLGVSVEELIYGEKRENVTIVNKYITEGNKEKVKAGISFGSCLAMVISFSTWHSVGWAILHGIFSWAYVIYYLIKYVW